MKYVIAIIMFLLPMLVIIGILHFSLGFPPLVSTALGFLGALLVIIIVSSD